MGDVNVVFEKDTVKRGKKKNFSVLGIPVGSELVFKNNSEIKCVTVDGVNLVESDGERMSISALASKINGYPSSGFVYFTWNGQVLSKLQGSPAWEAEEDSFVPGGSDDSLPDSQLVDTGSLEFDPDLVEVRGPDLSKGNAERMEDDPFNI
jgi:hypothetical protein